MMQIETRLQPLRLTLDAGHEQTNAQLRLAAAVIAGGGGVWLACVEQSMWLRLTALAGVLFAARWIASYRKALRTTRDASLHFIEITTQRVTLANGSNQRTIASERIERIELDEDRLAVVLCLDHGEDVVIEPVYGGLGLRELGETLQRYLSAKPGDFRPGCTELNP
jgi:hypothetical protein